MMAHAGPAGSARGVDHGTMECNGSTSNGANVYSNYASMSGTTKRSKVNHKSLPSTDPRVHVNAYGDANNEPAVMNMSVESSATTANGKLRPSVVADDCTSGGTPKKNRKRPPAFRIKTGSLVALRYRPEGNTVKDMDGNLLEELSPKAVVETWIDPIPGYHQGFMIIGCRIRCCFPKSVLLPDGVTSSASSALTENERKRFRYEQIIRGIDKVTVRVNLGISYGSKHCSSEKIGKDNVLVCKWVIRERVAIAPPLGGLSKQEDSQKKLYVGNTFDSHAQQEQNFRWLASRMDSDHTAGRYVGEVISVRPSSESLATVTVRMMKLPESTTRGRLLDQSQLELYELDRTREFQVPVEELVVASRKIRRCAEQDSDFATVSRIYSEERNSWRHQYQGDNADMPVDRLICHRCGVEGSDMFVDHIAITPSAISCSKCLQSCKKFGKSGTFLKACRCQGCASHHALALSEAFKNQPRKFVSRENQQLCAVCCLYCKSGMVCNDCGFTIHKRCAKWIQRLILDSARKPAFTVELAIQSSKIRYLRML
ncbi:[histone H3]-lysine4 N-trimethyltransferase SETD1 [Fragilaria crotonensis]|nr:[histone H3]-lysine4 N-trimethyltransferase SETD1 [Fragilaria crotonensis]